jgi:hypothetical protein
MVIGQSLMGADRVAVPTIMGMLTNWLAMGLAYGLADSVIDLNLFLGLGSLLGFLVLSANWVYEGRRNCEPDGFPVVPVVAASDFELTTPFLEGQRSISEEDRAANTLSRT